MSHLLAEYVVSANCWLQSKFSRKKYWHRQHESVSVALCWQKHDSSQQLLHDCWWTGVLWVVWWLIVVFDGNSCGNSVGLGLMIDDWSWLMVGFDDNSCWAAVKKWLTADRCDVIDGDRWLWQLWHDSQHIRPLQRYLLMRMHAQIMERVYWCVFTLKNIPAKFHPDPIWNYGALDLFEEVAPTRRRQRRWTATL